MAVSRKKAAAKKSPASKKKVSAASKKAARPKATRTKPAAKKTPAKRAIAKPKPPASKKPTKKAPPARPKSTKKAPPDRGRETIKTKLAEQQLAKALLEIRRLREDRDNQVAIAEAAEMERSMVVEQLREAEAKIQELEHRQAEQAIQAQAAMHPVAVDEEEVDFEEEEQEADADDLDDVEAIYGRLDDPRVRRQELDRERLDRESEAGDEPYWMICPKCGDSLEEVDAEDLKLDRCEACAGIYLDHGEVEMLLMLARGPDGLQRVTSALRL
jgi:hypothetical protein